MTHGFDRQDKPIFWIVGGATVGTGTHFALIARTRDQFDAFHAAAIAAGGADNSAPGLWRYHEKDYGAFVRDPDGINIEAVCNSPSRTPRLTGARATLRGEWGAPRMRPDESKATSLKGRLLRL